MKKLFVLAVLCLFSVSFATDSFVEVLAVQVGKVTALEAKVERLEAENERLRQMMLPPVPVPVPHVVASYRDVRVLRSDAPCGSLCTVKSWWPW